MKVYLEFRDQHSDKFWEIRVEGASHTIRYGEMNSAGHSLTKEFPSAVAALKDAQGLIASKRAKGYEDVQARAIQVTPVAAEMLSYEPIGEAQKALFTQELIGEHTLRCWERELDTLSEGMEAQPDAASVPREDMPLLAQELETIASWSCPDMQKEVMRDRDGIAQRIVYSVNGLPVLWLKSGAWDDMRTRRSCTPMMYFGGDESCGYFWFFGARFVEDFRLVLERFTHFCAERLPAIQKTVRRKVKEQKIRQVAEANIPMMVSRLLQGTGYEYKLKEGAKASTLRIKLGSESLLELSLPHKSFVTRAPDIIPTVERVKTLLEALPLLVRIGTKASEIYAKWGTVWNDTASDADRLDFESGFWEQALEAYVMSTLLRGNGARSKSRTPLEELAKWDFIGLKKNVENLTGNGINTIQYSIGAEYVFYVNEDGLNVDLCNDPEPQGILLWDLADSGNMPPLENWRAFLEGFVEFYQAQRERMPTAERAFQEALQRKMENARELGVAIQGAIRGGRAGVGAGSPLPARRSPGLAKRKDEGAQDADDTLRLRRGGRHAVEDSTYPRACGRGYRRLRDTLQSVLQG